MCFVLQARLDDVETELIGEAMTRVTRVRLCNVQVKSTLCTYKANCLDNATSARFESGIRKEDQVYFFFYITIPLLEMVWNGDV